MRRYSICTSPSFFFNHPATTEIYTLSLHDALPISARELPPLPREPPRDGARAGPLLSHDPGSRRRDRKSTRLNSSHMSISYAVFCLKKKKKIKHTTAPPGRIEGAATPPHRTPLVLC